MIYIGQPILLQTNAFDSTIDHTFEFSYSGNQVVKNTLTIKNNETDATVYSATVSSYQLRHTVPANTLTNGTCYNATLVVYDSDNVASSSSTPIVFWCYSTPSFSINIDNNQVIENISFPVEITYTQAQNEPLNFWQANLYDYDQKLILQSGIKYYVSNTSYTFTGLSDNEKYYIRCIGETLNGMEVDTGMIAFTVHYTAPTFFSLNEVSNDAAKGIIKLKTNIYIISGKSNPELPTYIDNSYVDLRTTGHWVTFDEGFSLSGDFCKQILCKDLNPNSVILYASGEEQSVALFYRHWLFEGDTTEKMVVQLVVYGKSVNYTTYTTPVAIPADTDWFYIVLTRKNGVYSLTCEEVEG